MAAKIKNIKEDNQFIPALVRRLKRVALRSGNIFDWQTYHIVEGTRKTITRLVRNYKRYLARLKAMLVNTENRRQRMLAVMLATHLRVGQASPMNMIDDALLAQIALLSVLTRS